MLGAHSLEVKLLGQASDNPCPFQSRAKIKIMCSYTSISPHMSTSRDASLTTENRTLNQAVHIALKG
jgi:hypothetical protein